MAYEEDPPTPPNNTLSNVLRSCEDGDSWNWVSAQLQDLQRDLRALAARKGSSAKGEFKLTLKLHMGRDGAQGVVADVATKKPKIPRLETTIWVTEDGEPTSRPAEKQLSLHAVSGGAAPERKAL